MFANVYFAKLTHEARNNERNPQREPVTFFLAQMYTQGISMRWSHSFSCDRFPIIGPCHDTPHRFGATAHRDRIATPGSRGPCNGHTASEGQGV
jgi:hypothetical protein